MICRILIFVALFLSSSQLPLLAQSNCEELFQRKSALAQDKFEKDLLKIKGFRNAGTFEELISEGDRVEKQWGNIGGNYYGELFVEFLGILSSNRYAGNNDVMEISRELASQSLKKANTFDLSIEWKLLLFLGAFDYPIDKLTEKTFERLQYI